LLKTNYLFVYKNKDHLKVGSYLTTMGDTPTHETIPALRYFTTAWLGDRAHGSEVEVCEIFIHMHNERSFIFNRHGAWFHPEPRNRSQPMEDINIPLSVALDAHDLAFCEESLAIKKRRFLDLLENSDPVGFEDVTAERTLQKHRAGTCECGGRMTVGRTTPGLEDLLIGWCHLTSKRFLLTFPYTGEEMLIYGVKEAHAEIDRYFAKIAAERGIPFPL
jgi:hypothetical protein